MTGNQYYKKPEDQSKKPGKRKCMCCDKPFPSEGIHNRLCDACKSSPAASGIADYGSGRITMRRVAR